MMPCNIISKKKQLAPLMSGLGAKITIVYHFT